MCIRDRNKRTLKDLIAPAGIDASQLNHLEIITSKTRYARSMIVLLKKSIISVRDIGLLGSGIILLGIGEPTGVIIASVSTICCALNQIIIGAFIPDDAKCNLHERAVVNHCNGPIPSVCTTAYAVISRCV